MTTCSTVHNDSMPHRSAVVARCVSRAGLLNGPEFTNINPSFMLRHLYRRFVVFSITLLTGTKSCIFSFLDTGCRGHPCPRKRETHGGFHIQIKFPEVPPPCSNSASELLVESWILEK